MPGRGSGRRRGFAIAGIALTLVLVAPELTPAVGATPTAVRAQQTVTTKAPRSGAKKTPAQKQAAARALARRKATARVLARRRAAARALAKKKALAKRGPSSLSLPLLGLYAIAPFLLIGIFLLGSDYRRRRPPRKRHASLVITRVGDR
jgi:hypothetical protein